MKLHFPENKTQSIYDTAGADEVQFREKNDCIKFDFYDRNI